MTSVHMCNHLLTSILHHTSTYSCKCMSCFFYTSWLCAYIFLVLGNRTSLRSPFFDAVLCLGAIFFVSVGLLVFLHSKHPVYCFSAHASPTLYSPTVWSHQKELLVSRFPKSWGEQKVGWFYRSFFFFLPKSELGLLLWVTVCNIWDDSEHCNLWPLSDR